MPLPSELADLNFTPTIVDTDTETSGLFADDGARVSTVSLAFEIPDGTHIEGMTCKVEQIAPGVTANIASIAWPFDQGLIEGKPEWRGQDGLWAPADNLSSYEWRALLEFLGDHELGMHNGKFDLEKFRVGCRPWPGVGTDLQHCLEWDTQNVNDLIFPLYPTSLKPTCERLFGTEYGDDARIVKQYLKKAKLPPGRWDLIPWDVIGSYADLDSRLTCMLRLRQYWEIEHNGAADWLYRDLTDEERADRDMLGLTDIDLVYDAIHRRLNTSLSLYRMEWRGLPYHEVESRDAAQECASRASAIAIDLPFTATLPKAKHFFFGDGVTDRGVRCLNMVPYAISEKTEDPSMTSEIVERMVEDEIPFADKWLDWNKVDNAQSMWYNGYADKMGADGRLRCAFRQNGTRSTRFSVERVNLQAIPQDYRLSAFTILDGIPTPRRLIARAVECMEGWRLFELDLAQAELRVAADMAGCQSMLDLILHGDDLHAVTTQQLFQMDDTHPEWPKYRQVGKRGNFSLIFGAEWLTFQRMVSKETGIRLADHEAQRIVREWNMLYPEFRRAIEKHSRAVAVRQSKFQHGWIKLINGERRWFQIYEETHKAFNQRVQGNLAQFGIDWMLQTDEYLRASGYGEENGAGLLLTIHDSQVLLLPDDARGQQLADTCAGFGRELWSKTFPGVPGEVDYHAW